MPPELLAPLVATPLLPLVDPAVPARVLDPAVEDAVPVLPPPGPVEGEVSPVPPVLPLVLLSTPLEVVPPELVEASELDREVEVPAALVLEEAPPEEQPATSATAATLPNKLGFTATPAQEPTQRRPSDYSSRLPPANGERAAGSAVLSAQSGSVEGRCRFRRRRCRRSARRPGCRAQ